MKVIVPCCGASSRFPGRPPKWTLPAHDGKPMICQAVAGLEVAVDDLVVTVLAEHEERFGVTQGLAAAFGQKVEVVCLAERTRSQSETVARTLEMLACREAFLVKDADNGFTLTGLAQPENYVCTEALSRVEGIEPRSKSYVQVDGQQRIVAIREKEVISDRFNVGGYYFTDPAEFLQYYRRLEGGGEARELYLSAVIGAMIGDGVVFRARPTSGYKDWGTINDWQRAVASRQAYFVLLDGFLFQRGSLYFKPRFGEVEPHDSAVAAVKSLAAAGNQISYLSVRPASLEALTRRQLAAAGLPDGPVLWNCPFARWVLLTAAHDTLPVESGAAIVASPDDPRLLETINGNPTPHPSIPVG